MATQFALAGGEPRAVRHRLFFALMPPPLLARRISLYAEEQGVAMNRLAWHRLHITLAITDDSLHFSRAHADALLRVGAAVAEQVAALDISLDHLSGGQRSAALRHHRTPALVQLADRIAGAMAGQGLTLRHQWRFNPHMTLWYGDCAPISRPCRPFAWCADRLVLIHSLVGRTRHEPLGQWPFSGVAAQGDLFG